MAKRKVETTGIFRTVFDSSFSSTTRTSPLSSSSITAETVKEDIIKDNNLAIGGTYTVNAENFGDLMGWAANGDERTEYTITGTWTLTVAEKKDYVTAVAKQGHELFAVGSYNNFAAAQVVIELTDEVMSESLNTRKAMFDKSGDSHYDNISAFIKSMRGSDVDATVFYLARALNAGEDPVFLARRITICASEDVGMANPNALVVATSAMQAVNMIGMPEARIILSEAACYVAKSPKSNASYMAINKALEDVKTKDTGLIPMHIRNAPASRNGKIWLWSRL